MKLAEEMVRCKTQAEVIRVVDVEARSILRDLKRKLIEEALEHLVEEHYGPRWQREREPGATPWTCLECGPRDTTQVKRNGHYLRQLVVLEGVITIRVPQLRCQVCGRGVALAALFLPLRKRYWIDLDQEITKLYLSGVSYRQLRYMVEKRIDSGAGLMSLWRRFQEVAQRAPSISPLPHNLYTCYQRNQMQFNLCSNSHRQIGRSPGRSRGFFVDVALINPLFVDNDAAASEGCGWVGSVRSAHLVIVDNGARRFVPDLNPELVNTNTTPAV